VNDGGTWNRAGRRSGGDRPTIVQLPTRELTEAEERENARRELLDGIAHHSPISLIVAFLVRGDPEIADALRRANVRYDRRYDKEAP
jgi:hypothetical protein